MEKQSKSLLFRFCLTGLSVCFLALGQTQGDSLWSNETAVSLYTDHKAKRVGDIITVIVLESNSASRNSSAKTEKKSDINASISNFINPNLAGKVLGKVQSPKLGTTSQSKFEGKGAVNNSGSFNSRFAVRVVDVLPNNNLIIEGVRRTTFSGESQTIVLKGTVRPRDVTPLNTVYSYHLADVSIGLKDDGAVSDSLKKGWFSKLWGKIAPF
ncbi:MAG: flagellar basal body L-ring protein FlgH [Verrucomicrobia bacterium]|nr:flagellar basal body L-ring protein FlgH [Verrucomicrobiota bacterium]